MSEIKASSSSTAVRNTHGIDSLLQSLGKSLPVGGSLRIKLIKGPHHGSLTADPVEPKAPKQAFPLLAKFPESVVPPDFSKEPWKSARLYQQNVPKPLDDSDDDAADNTEKKKRRWRQYDQAPKRQWVLQEQVDFLESMVAKRQKSKTSSNKADTAIDNSEESSSNKISSRYEGIPEHNPSHFMLLQVQQPQDDDDMTDAPTEPSSISLQILPSALNDNYNTIQFAQPASRKTFSLSQAEVAMEQQRGLVRNLHHVPGRGAAANSNNNNSKSRLLGKLLLKQQPTSNEEEADDVMADVAFRSRKGAGGGARKELLSSLADSSVRVGDDGVLGGTNDAVFAARQRFNAFQTGGAASNNKNDRSNNGQERGADGAAMQDDFYQRDVQAEYEEMDFDANELFDDDDVDVGETEVNFDEADYEGVDEEDEEEELDEEEEAVTGAAGLASVAGFKMMLAKARGEISNAQATDAAAEAASNDADGKKDDAGGASPNLSPKLGPVASKSGDKTDHISQIMAAADKAAQAAKERASQQPIGAKAAPDAAVIQIDENGLRIITLEAVRREIWLNHGSIPMKRLMKIFDIKKKSSPDRQDKFRNVVKELCIMKNDPIGGRLLVLKQHYSNL